jgi:hypothetical protein
MDDTVFSEPSQVFSPSRKRNQKRFALLIVAVLIVVIFSVFITIANTNKSKTKIATTTTTTEVIVPTTTEEITPNPEETSTPTPKPTVSPVDKKTGLNRSKLSITVENGSGEVGAAGKVADVLKNLGYNVSSTGNADNYDYQNLTIRTNSSFSDYLALLKSDLEGKYTIGDTSSDLSASISADALIIIGK